MSDFLDEMAKDAEEQEQNALDNLDTDKLHSVSLLAQQQVELENQINGIEDDLKELRKDLFKLSTQTIPERMKEIGIKSLEMDTGERLSVVKNVTASITAKNKELAHKWLVEYGHGDLIKHTVTTKFSRGEEDVAKEFVNKLNEQGLNYDVKQAVHAMTLKAFVKEQLEKGNELDMELLGVFEYEVTKITVPKRGR
jgi:hypothetical protein